jgi:hypothetical protein
MIVAQLIPGKPSDIKGISVLWDQTKKPVGVNYRF